MIGDVTRAAVFVLLLLVPGVSADTAINGTWSGNWTPKGGVPDAVTIELRQNSAGMITGKFLNPAPMEFSKVVFNAKTGMMTAEATDQKSGKHYKLEGKIEGTELKGTLGAGDTAGDVRLIKWTFFGR
jgi:hypothetical protein